MNLHRLFVSVSAATLLWAGGGRAGGPRLETDARVLALFVNQDLTQTPLNPANALALPDQSMQLHLRADFYYHRKDLDIVAKPRVILDQSEIPRPFPFLGDEQTEEAFLNEWYLRYRLDDRFTMSAGRENLQWGPSFLLSPSNPFLGINGRQRPQFEVPGLDYVRLVWVPSTAWSVSAIVNVGEGRLDTFGTFRETQALKLDWTGERRSASLIASHREGGEDVFGFYGLASLSDAQLLYTEGSIEDGDLSLLVGSSYTFRDGEVLAVEYFRDGRGLLSLGGEIVGSSASATSLSMAGVPVSSRDQDFVLVQYSDVAHQGDFKWTLRMDQALDDDGARYIALLNYEVSDDFEIFLNGSVNDGGARSNFGALVENVFVLGGKRTF